MPVNFSCYPPHVGDVCKRYQQSVAANVSGKTMVKQILRVRLHSQAWCATSCYPCTIAWYIWCLHTASVEYAERHTNQETSNKVKL